MQILILARNAVSTGERFRKAKEKVNLMVPNRDQSQTRSLTIVVLSVLHRTVAWLGPMTALLGILFCAYVTSAQTAANPDDLTPLSIEDLTKRVRLFWIQG
jgi:hypothetical protein